MQDLVKGLPTVPWEIPQVDELRAGARISRAEEVARRVGMESVQVLCETAYPGLDTNARIDVDRLE